MANTTKLQWKILLKTIIMDLSDIIITLPATSHHHHNNNFSQIILKSFIGCFEVNALFFPLNFPSHLYVILFKGAQPVFFFCYCCFFFSFFYLFIYFLFNKKKIGTCSWSFHKPAGQS